MDDIIMDDIMKEGKGVVVSQDIVAKETPLDQLYTNQFVQ